MRCPVCGAANAACVHKGYRPTFPPDLLDERSNFVARQTKTEIVRMPKQYVRPGRGTPGYKTQEGVKLETFETESFRQAAASAPNAKAPTKAELRKQADELGVEGLTARSSNAEIAAAIAAKQAEGDGNA